MKLYFFILYACFIFSSSAEVTFVTVPQGIVLSQEKPPIKDGEISSIISNLMGLSSSNEMYWKGVSQMNFFKRPKANLFLNVFLPLNSKLSLLHAARYQMNEQEIPSLDTTNTGLYHLFQDQKPMLVQYETDASHFSTSKLNADMLDNLPGDLDRMRLRLAEDSSVVKERKVDPCLNLDEDAAVIFFGELQTLSDILKKLIATSEQVKDSTPDSFYFSLTGLSGLVNHHGADSNQVRAAVEVLNSFLSQYVMSFDAIYDGRLLSEVSVVREAGRSFAEASIRRTRSLLSTDVSANDTAPIKNVTTPLSEDYPVVVNLTFWVVVVFALATLATSYGIWYMDPGTDSVIYRVTNQRLKTD